MLPASSCNENCGSNLQIDWLTKFLRPSNSLFHFVNWIKIAPGILQGNALLCRCNVYSLILLQSGFSKHSSFLVSKNFFFFLSFGEEYHLPGDISNGKVKETSAQSKQPYWCGRLCAVFSSGVNTETRSWIQRCSRDTSSAGVCFGLRWFTMWCICKQDMPKLEPFICLPFPSLKCIAFSYNRALIKTSSDFWPFSGKKGRRTGWIFALSHPLSLFGCGFCGMALFCRLEFERQNWFFSPRNQQDSPRET